MATFIRLTLVDKLAALNNKPIWVNVDSITTVFEEENHTTLWLVNATEEYPGNLTVKETPDEIFHTMEEI